MQPYAELWCQSAFSFHEGASQPEELAERASDLGLAALGIADTDGVYGLVRGWKAAKRLNLRCLHGTLLAPKLDVSQGAKGPAYPALPLYACTKLGWSHLCDLLTLGKEPTDPNGPWEGKQPFRIGLMPVLERAEDLIALLGHEWLDYPQDAALLTEAFGDRIHVACSRQLLPSDSRNVDRAEELAALVNRPLVAVNRVLMHDPGRKRLQDVFRCIREKTPLHQAGTLLEPNAERHLKGPGAMSQLWRDHPDRVGRTVELASRCTFHLGQLKYNYPQEVVPNGHTPLSWLRDRVEFGICERWPDGVPAKVRNQVDHEMRLIEKLNYATYFLTVYDIVLMAREREILCQGRGSAANSAVCYCLGITAVDPEKSNMLFERFLSEERGEPPDIDVDFEHERREEVIQDIYDKYGRDRAAMVNEVISYRPRSAIRDVGKALGLSLEQVDRLAKVLNYWSRGPLPESMVSEAGLDPDDPAVHATLALSEEIYGFPRHVSIHVGGFVIAEHSLRDRCPIEPATMPNRTVIQWDKDDVDAVGFVKVDVLALGMLSAIRKCFEMIEDHHDRTLTLATLPSEDPYVYDTACRADTIGVFQIESRAQMSMLPRLQPRCFYDLVIEISIVRPGPIQGGMVHPYLDRRDGLEPVRYAHPALESILSRTLGVPIFQEQVMEMAMAIGGFCAGEADALRRAMGAWRKRGGLEPLVAKLMANLQTEGISREYAQQIAKQILGFGEYGFPESHAASFALLVYVSLFLKTYYPAAFCASLLNAQPMGFYSASSLVGDARRHHVEVRPVRLHASDWDCTLEPDGRVDPRVGGTEGIEARGVALRLGLREVKGLGEDEGLRIVAARNHGGPYRSIADLARRASLDRGALTSLARADVLADLGLSRREAVWAVEGLWTQSTPLLEGLASTDDGERLPIATRFEEMQLDYKYMGLSLKAHPIGLAREWLARRGVVPISRLLELEPDRIVKIAGLVTSRQRPMTASGVVFMSLEDETGMANVVVWPKVFDSQRRVARGENLVMVTGKLQRQNEAISIVIYRFRKIPQSAWSDLATLQVKPPAFQKGSRDFR
jgi:error-prone DNA polymerase